MQVSPRVPQTASSQRCSVNRRGELWPSVCLQLNSKSRIWMPHFRINFYVFIKLRVADSKISFFKTKQHQDCNYSRHQQVGA